MGKTFRRQSDVWSDFKQKGNRDGKPWHKPNKSFKKCNRHGEREFLNSATKKAIVDEDVPIVDFPKTDEWDYL